MKSSNGNVRNMILGVILILLAQSAVLAQNNFIRGDANCNGIIDTTDVNFLAHYVFIGPPVPPCLDAADVNDDGIVNNTDIVVLANFLLSDGPLPAPPFPTCGPDPTADGLTCDSGCCFAPIPLRNHYKTWMILTLPVDSTPVDTTVLVQDPFMQDSLKLDSIHFLSNPAQKDSFGILRPDDHLSWYKARGRDTSLVVYYMNQFETTTVVIDSVKYLLVPTQKLPNAPPESLDHYKCYRIKDKRTLVRQVQLQDQFDLVPEIIDTLTPLYFCTPAKKNNEPGFDASTYYLAYLIKPQRDSFIVQSTVDQFGQHSMLVQHSELLLVPTVKIVHYASPLRNHFKTWSIILTAPVDTTVSVQDQFMQDSLRLDSLVFLSNPVIKVVGTDTSAINRPNDHLTWYKAEGRDTLLWVEYENQFESTAVAIDSAKFLLLPTRKLPLDKPDQFLSHYKAYKIRNPKTLIKQIKLRDQFDLSPDIKDTLVSAYFCSPAIKNNEPKLDPDTHYVAYLAKPQRSNPQASTTEDQFGQHDMLVANSEMLMVPTYKISFGACLIRAGDANASGTYTLADVIAIVNYIFNKPGCSPQPLCWLSDLLCRGDWNGSGTVSLSDVIQAVNFIFNKPGGPWNALPSGICCLP